MQSRINLSLFNEGKPNEEGLVYSYLQRTKCSSTISCHSNHARKKPFKAIWKYLSKLIKTRQNEKHWSWTGEHENLMPPAAIKNQTVLWTFRHRSSSNPINIAWSRVSFILILFPRGEMTRSQTVCSILLKPHLLWHVYI